MPETAPDLRKRLPTSVSVRGRFSFACVLSLVEDSSQRTKRAIDTVFGHPSADGDAEDLGEEPREEDEQEDLADPEDGDA